MDPLTESPSDAIQTAAGASPAAAQGHPRTGWISRTALTGPLCLVLLVCGFCWKLTLTSDYTWIDNPDITRMDVPRLQFQRMAWHNHEFPLWDPYLWCGQPFLGQIVGAAFPLNWPFLRLPRGSVGLFSLTALNWYFVFLHLIGAFSAYWLCREIKLGVTASLLGGLVYSFGGFTGATLWPEVLSSIVVAPLVFVFLVRALRGQREFTSAALSGMCLGLAWLSGHHEVPIYLSLTVGAIWLYGFVWRRHDWRKWLLLACVSVLVATLTSGFQVLPGYEYAKLALRWVGTDHPVTWDEAIPYRVDAQYSLTPSSLISLIVAWSGANSDGFTGVAAVALAVIAVISLWHDRWVRLFGCVVLGSLLLAFGEWNPVHGLLYTILPLFGKARTPLRMLSMVQLGVAVLAAAGVHSLRNATPALLRGAARALLLWAAGVFALGIAAGVFHQPALPEFLYLSAVIALLLGCLLLAGQHGSISSRVVPAAVLALVFIELGSGVARVFYDRTPGQRTTFLPELARYHEAANYLRSQPGGPVRVYGMEVTDAFNLGDWEGVDTLTGFGAGVTSNVMGIDWASVHGQNLLGVGYTLSKAPTPRADQTLALHGAGFNLYKNNDAFPRAWIVHQTETAPSADRLRGRLNDPAFDARHIALLEGRAPELQSCGGAEEARISRRTANTVFLEARLACRGMMILSDTWYPGWSARVDGRTTEIYQADSGLRGLVIEPGAHRIEFRYRPASAILGALMSILGVLAVLGIAFWERRRTRV